MTPVEALIELEKIIIELAKLRLEYVDMIVAEKLQKAQSWLQSEGNNQARDNYSTFNVIDTTREVMALRAEIENLETKRDFLALVVQHG